MQSRKVLRVNVLSIFHRLHPLCILVYCVDRTSVHCELVHCVQITQICWQYHPDNISVSPPTHPQAGEAPCGVDILRGVSQLYGSGLVLASLVLHPIPNHTAGHGHYHQTAQLEEARGPQYHSTWDHCPVSLSWENKLVGSLPAAKDWSYNFKLISFRSGGD